jgi:hypothetical protein
MFALSPPEQNETRFVPFREMVFRFYKWRWGYECPWSAGEGKQLSELLKSSPTLDLPTFALWLKRYGESEDIAPGERPRRFLPRIHNYSVAALDRFGRDKNAKNGETFAERDARSTSSAIERVRQNLASTERHVDALGAGAERGKDSAVARRHKQLPG